MTVSTQVPTAAEMVRANIMAFANGAVSIGIGIMSLGGLLTEDLFPYILLAYGVTAFALDWYLFGSPRRRNKLYEDRLLALIAPLLVAMPFMIALEGRTPDTMNGMGIIFLMGGSAWVVISVADLRERKDKDAR